MKSRRPENENPFVTFFCNAESIFRRCMALLAFGIGLRRMPGHLRQQFFSLPVIYSTPKFPIAVEDWCMAWPFHCACLLHFGLSLPSSSLWSQRELERLFFGQYRAVNVADCSKKNGRGFACTRAVVSLLALNSRVPASGGACGRNGLLGAVSKP